MMDTQTLILLSVGFITLATMIYCILRSEDDEPQKKDKHVQFDDEPEEIFYDDESSNYATIDDGEEESIFDSE